MKTGAVLTEGSGDKSDISGLQSSRARVQCREIGEIGEADEAVRTWKSNVRAFPLDANSVRRASPPLQAHGTPTRENPVRQ